VGAEHTEIRSGAELRVLSTSTVGKGEKEVQSKRETQHHNGGVRKKKWVLTQGNQTRRGPGSRLQNRRVRGGERQCERHQSGVQLQKRSAQEEDFEGVLQGTLKRLDPIFPGKSRQGYGIKNRRGGQDFKLRSLMKPG